MDSTLLLIQQGQFERAVTVLDNVSSHIQGQHDWSLVLKLLEYIPDENRLSSTNIANIYAKALARNHCSSDLYAFAEQVSQRHGVAGSAIVQVECAAVLLEANQYSKAASTLRAQIPFLSGNVLGIAWSRLGLADFYLNGPWYEAYAIAKTLLSGIELSKALINEGFCFAESNQGSNARQAWIEALPHLSHYPDLLVWTRYNLGVSALRDLETTAEQHFLEAMRFTRTSSAAKTRAPVLNGLSATRRTFGEWQRAESTYREALAVAADTHDRKESYLGLARTLRLAGRLFEALETLEFALSDTTLESNLFHVARAKVFLVLNQNDHARQSLERVGHLVSTSDQWLERIARAELARRDGHLDEAVTLLEGLPVHTLHAREEVRQWPQLFQLLEAAGKPVPVPLEYVQGMTVRIAALGVLRVTVNDRGVPIVPTGRVGELLVFLLEHGGVASLEVISEALYPDVTHERARKSVWMLVKFLRTALGWDGAVIALRAAYQLDPNVTWQYDVREARAHGTHGAVQGDFLEGVYSDWALEVGRALEALNSPNGRNLELN
jgi:tetratricopeptide (TPR) repeat protein